MKRLYAGAGCGWLLILVLTAAAVMLTPPLCMFDFTAYYRSAVNLVHARNPYDIPHPTQYLSDCSASYMPSPSSPKLAVYPPPFALPIYACFAWMNQARAKQLFLFMLLFVPLLCAYACLRAMRLASGAPLRFLVLLGLAAFPFGTASQALLWGSPSWIALLGILLFLQAVRREHFFAAGAALFLCWVKPHLLLLPAAGVLSWTIFHRRPQVILGLVTATFAGLLGAVLLRPGVVHDYFLSLSYSAHGSLGPLQYGGATIAGLLRQSGNSWWSAALLIVALPLALLSGKREPSLPDLLLRLLPFSMLIAPYGWAHDYLILMPVAFHIAGRALEARLRGASMRAALAVLGLLTANILTLIAGVQIYTPNLLFLGANMLWCGLILVVERGESRLRPAD